MTDDVEVLRATQRFYEALDILMAGGGIEAMRASWHHTPRVTSAHPMGDWAYGWEEVEATWAVFASIGKPTLAGSRITDLRAWVYGEFAYTTCVFHTTPIVGDFKLSCTNVLQRIDGVWKVIHHHPDKVPAVAEAIQRIAESD